MVFPKNLSAMIMYHRTDPYGKERRQLLFGEQI